jgi:hypothetical protein
VPEPLLAHHIVQALPFFAPVLLIVVVLGGIVAADRLRGGGPDA